MKSKLTKEETELLKGFEKGEWVSVADLSKRKKDLVAYARKTLKKDKRLDAGSRSEPDAGLEPGSSPA